MAANLQKIGRQIRQIINEKLDAEEAAEQKNLRSLTSHHFTGSDEGDTVKFSRCKPESIEKLSRSTRFSKEELQIIYRGFKQQCPNGYLKEETLKHIFASFFPQGDSSEYAHYVFLAIDPERTGSISFERFISTLSILSRGTIEEKLRWIFQLYDIDGDGFLSRPELLMVASSIYHLLGKWTRPLFHAEVVEDHIDTVIKRMNPDSEGYVSYPSFLQYCLGDRNVIESMKSLDTAVSASIPPNRPSSLLPSGSNASKFGRDSTLDVVMDESPSEILPATTIQPEQYPDDEPSPQRHYQVAPPRENLSRRSSTLGSMKRSRLKSIRDLF